jgi:hypothetical protein
MTKSTSSPSDISTLRVAQAELISGDTSGKVYVRLSEGAVAFLTKRPVAEARVKKMIQQEISKQPVGKS